MHLIGRLDIGGAEKLTRLIVEHLDPSRFEGSVCCLKWAGDYAPELRARGFAVHDLGGYAQGTPMTPCRAARVTRKLYWLLRRERPDVIHAHLFWASVLARVVGRLAGVRRVIVTLHRIEYPRVEGWIEQMLAPWTERYIVDSHAAAAMLSQHIGIAAPRLDVVWNGIDPTEFASAPSPEMARKELALPAGRPVVGVVAHLYPEKGHSFLLEAVARLRTDLPDVLLLVVGDGFLRPHLEAQSRALGLAEAVRFLGARGDLPRLLAAMDICVLPSRWEGFGLILAEAMYMGTPVVTTKDSGGVTEVVQEGEGGMLVSFGDVEGLAGAMLRLLRDEEWRREQARKGRARVERLFTVTRMIKDYEALYAAPGSSGGLL